MVAGHGRQLRFFAGELRVCGLERRLARPDATTTAWIGSLVRPRTATSRCLGELNLGATRGLTVRASSRWPSALAKGHHTALQKTVSALATPFEQHRDRFIEQWHRVANPEWLAAKSCDGGKLMRASHNVLLAHEDKTFSGAFVASASIPWGQANGDDDLGGYHLVWTRDMVQTATALLACGRAETARRALVYLACTQEPDGGFAQNFWVDGRPYWSGVQLDEVAFPIILAWRLWKADALGDMDIFPFVERAAGFLVQHAPITHQERWEENAGYSPSTLAAVICGTDLRSGYCRARTTRRSWPSFSRSLPTGSSATSRTGR